MACDAEPVTSPSAPPPGFELVRTSAFAELIGPLYVAASGSAVRFGARVGPEHANTFGGAHGGFIASLVDVAAGRGTRLLLADGRSFRTVSMTTDFTGRAAVGDWLEAEVVLDRAGGRTVFVSCRVRSGDELVARASVVLAATST